MNGLLYSPVSAMERTARRKVALLFEAGCSLLIAWIMIRTLPYHRLRSIVADDYPVVPRSGSDELGMTADVGWSIAAITRRLRRKVCLKESVAAWAMLRRRGIACGLHLGVRSEHGQITAHAWTESRGVVVTGGSQAPAAFAELGPTSESNYV